MTRIEVFSILAAVLIATLGPQLLVACADLHAAPMQCPDYVWDCGEDC